MTTVSGQIKNRDFINMQNAGKDEYNLAVELEVNENGTLIISLITDNAWSKRSYKINYNAFSGVGSIIGARTGKILHIGVIINFVKRIKKS